jgi:hypothetical protein
VAGCEDRVALGQLASDAFSASERGCELRPDGADIPRSHEG